MGPTYQISLLKAIIRTQGIQMRRMAQKHERELEEIKVCLTLYSNCSSSNPNPAGIFENDSSDGGQTACR